MPDTMGTTTTGTTTTGTTTITGIIKIMLKNPSGFRILRGVFHTLPSET